MDLDDSSDKDKNKRLPLNKSNFNMVFHKGGFHIVWYTITKRYEYYNIQYVILKNIKIYATKHLL